MNPLYEAHLQGRAAAFRGDGPLRNPYAIGSDLRRVWRAAFYAVRNPARLAP